jgi:hypothetical protein
MSQLKIEFPSRSLWGRTEFHWDDGTTSYCYIDPEGRTGFLAYTKKRADAEFERKLADHARWDAEDKAAGRLA